MFATPSPTLLRKLLLLDALLCTVTGAMLTASATPLAGLTAIPAPLLFWAGVVLFPVAAFMAAVATGVVGWRHAVGLIILGNGLWALASVGLMLGPWIAPNALGHAFIGFQALVVVFITALEYRASCHNGTLAPA